MEQLSLPLKEAPAPRLDAWLPPWLGEYGLWERPRGLRPVETIKSPLLCGEESSMSLDVSLTMADPVVSDARNRIFVREDGQTKEIAREEWDQRHPGREPCMVQTEASNEVFEANITHNLSRMADAAGLYEPLWRPDECGITQAAQLIAPLRSGLTELLAHPERYRPLNPSNGWGSYEVLCRFIEAYLAACERYPTAAVSVSR